MKAILPISYLGSIDYYAVLAQADRIILEACETFPKQTLRNRCRIYEANGALDLMIPIDHSSGKSISQIRFDDGTPWRNKHWQALLSAYKSSPFFEFIEEDLKQFYVSGDNLLFSELLMLQKLICKFLGIKVEFETTTDFVREYSGALDLRDKFKPSRFPQLFQQEPYHQVFSARHGYIPNLSVLDLLCAEGRNSLTYLKSIEIKI